MARRRERKWVHGSSTPTYFSWRSMRYRCRSPKSHGYPHYGGRGITYCARWESFDNFYDDMGERPPGRSLDRIDVNGHYSPENCKWSTLREQLNNQRRSRHISHAGETKTIGMWAEGLGLQFGTLWRRLQRMPPERALRTGSIMPKWQHGTRHGYTVGCRCDSCKGSHNTRMREARARRKAKATSLAVA